MRVGILVADESEARIYEAEQAGQLHLVGRLEDKNARMHDRDFKSDRPGRVFDRAPPINGRRGAVGHHSTGGERHPRDVEMQLFAHAISDQLEDATMSRQFDRLILIAAPRFLGALRRQFPQSLKLLIKAEIHKDLIHEPESVVHEHLPVDTFR